MSDRLVVCFRSPELFVEPSAYLAAARKLGERAAALGGQLISWGATVYAYELDADSVQDAVELALSVVRDPSSGSSVGISEGTLESGEEGSGKRILRWGVPLVHATALARAARPGEVLVDPSLGAVRRGELLTVGSRVGVYGRLRLRGLLLDVRHPFRTALSESSRALVTPPQVGASVLEGFDVAPGKVSVVRAAHGSGGSRLLEALEERLEPVRTLHVTAHPFGEPLGALRRALLRAVTVGQAPLNLTGHVGQSLDALLSGEGLDPDSSAELLSIWLLPDAPNEPAGAIVLDDAAEIDADTLEVVARSLQAAGEPFRVIVRVGESELLPEALASLPRGPELGLGPLSVEDAVTLARSCTGGDLDDKAAMRWANRGSRLPLGVVESVREAVESGEIVWEGGRAIARLKSSGTGGGRPPKHWVKRRLEHVEPGPRRVLEALAVLGGQAEAGELVAVVRRRDDLRMDLPASLAVLESIAWVVRSKPDLLALASITHRDAVLATFSDSDFRAWHTAACEALADSSRPLAVAAATVHAVLAGDVARARELARRAAAVTHAMGLEVTANAFDALSEKGELGPLSLRNLFTAQLEIARAAPSMWPESSFSSIPPALEGAAPTAAPLAASAPEERREPASDVVPPPERVDGAPDDVDDAALTLRRPSEPPSAAMEALRTGDPEAVERVAEQIRSTDRRTALADRLAAMAKLARGQTGDAIRRLRDAADEARRTESRDRCRTALALGVALAAGGRHEEALLEALDALARAREMGDAKGERASLRFLSQLAETAGHHDVAQAWSSLADE